MAKKQKRNQKWKSIYPKHSYDARVVWLAELFCELVPWYPNLTIERFASDHVIEPHLIKRFIDEELGKKKRKKKVVLWHGTTDDRARAIMEEGFRTVETRGKIWFTRDSGFARSHATGRSKQRGGAPVVFHCNIDLKKYSYFSRRGPHYAFRYSHISKDVIRGVFRRRSNRLEADVEMDIIVTKTSGKLGVLSWINRYLEMEGAEAISEDHPAVEAAFKWVEAQYAQGRDELISDEEMFIQVMTHMKQE